MTDLRGIDVNLIVALDAILAERNLTRAAATSGLTQPAVTSAMSKLRRILNDPLLVRNGRTFDLTPRAIAVQPLVRRAMEEIDRTLDLRPTFDPPTSDRRFSIAASDYVLATMTSPLLSVLSREAPRASVEFTTLGSVTPLDLLRQDVVIAGAGRAVPGKRQSLFSDGFVCVVRRDHPRLADGELSLESLSAMPYLQVVLSEHIVTVADDALVAAGVKPRIAMTTTGFVTVPYLVADSDMFGFVPSRLADLYAANLGLVVARTPLPRATLVEVAYWHPSKTNDPAVHWLVGILRTTAEIVEFGTL